MTFSTVRYECLRNNILNLSKEYSSCLARFTIIKPKPIAPVLENDLVILLARVNEYVIQCATARKSQREVFTKLTDEVRPFINGTPSEIKQATLYLLGGLIHRLLRIETEYSDYNNSKYNVYSWFSSANLWDVNNCSLYNAIMKALQLSEDNKLDEYTIINALEVFQKNMYMEIDVEEVVSNIKTKVKKERYKTYSHFNTVDQNFKENLDALIKKYQHSGAQIIRHFHAINFFKSLIEALEKENHPVELEINEWCKNLNKTYKDFSQLNRELIELHLYNYFQSSPEKAAIKERLQELLVLGFEVKDFASIKEHSVFLEEMRMCNTDESRSICCGAYILLLKKGELDKKLVTLMTDAFGFDEKLTIEDQRACLRNFKKYLNDEPKPHLNCDFFRGGWEAMTSQITQLSVSLAETTTTSLVM